MAYAGKAFLLTSAMPKVTIQKQYLAAQGNNNNYLTTDYLPQAKLKIKCNKSYKLWKTTEM